jgi:hypothetical protein
VAPKKKCVYASNTVKTKTECRKLSKRGKENGKYRYRKLVRSTE